MLGGIISFLLILPGLISLDIMGVLAAALGPTLLSEKIRPHVLNMALAWPVLWTAVSVLIACAKRVMTERPGTIRIIIAGLFSAQFAGFMLYMDKTSAWVYDGSISALAIALLPLIAGLAVLCGPEAALHAIEHPPGPKTIRVLYGVLIVTASFLLLEFQLDGDIAITIQYSLLSILYCALPYMTIVLLTDSPKLAAAICLSAAWFTGAANLEMLTWRGDYITFRDILALKTGLDIGSQYELHFTPKLMRAVAAYLLILSIALQARLPRMKSGIGQKTKLLAVILLPCAVLATTGPAPGIAGLNADLKQTIDTFGYIPTFLSSATSSGGIPDAPDGYNPAAMEELLSVYKNNARSADRLPDIILIQNESWTDVTSVGDVRTNKDCCTFLKSLDENTQKFMLDTPNLMGPTAFTEFEVTHRTSMLTLPSGCNPIISYATEIHMPNMTDVLKAQDRPYKTILFHPYRSTAYERRYAYPIIGFDECVFYDSWDGKDVIRDLVSDRQNMRDLISLYEDAVLSDPERPVFLFNITIQNHGSYDKHDAAGIQWDDPVKITNFESNGELDILVNSMHETDIALRELVEYIDRNELGRDVIICMYGDHQPYLFDESLTPITERSWYDDPDDIRSVQHQTPCVIHANYDIPELDEFRDGNVTATKHFMSSGYLGSYLLDLSGIKTSAYDRYVLDQWRKYPSITFDAITDDEGTLCDPYDTSVLPDLEAMQYYLLFDPDHDETLFVP